MEKISIKNFGGLKNIEFEFKKINIIIGPQASGKSITVKLTFFFKDFFKSIFKSIIEGDTKRDIDNKQKEKFITYFPREAWGTEDFEILYEINESYIKITRNGSTTFKIEYSADISKTIKKGRKLYADELGKFEGELRVPRFTLSYQFRQRFEECLSSDIDKLTAYDQYFVPAGRSFFANLQSGIFSFLSNNRQLDPFLIEFGSFYETFKQYTGNRNDTRKKRSHFENLESELINGEYILEKDKDYLMHKDNRKVNLTNASSGQQEILPLILIMRALYEMKFRHGATLYIEEPEAHLFPTAQRKIVQLLSRVFNERSESMQLIITTHSPYIVSSFNNLLEAGRIINEEPKHAEQVYKIIPKNEVINPKYLVAYSLQNGVKRMIIDEETQLISQNILDGVSDDISVEFGNLLEIGDDEL